MQSPQKIMRYLNTPLDTCPCVAKLLSVVRPQMTSQIGSCEQPQIIIFSYQTHTPVDLHDIFRAIVNENIANTTGI